MSAADPIAVGSWISVRVAEVPGINGCWMGVIPEGTKMPAARFTIMVPRDTRVVDGTIVLTITDYLVVLTAEGSAAGLAQLSRSMHEALHLATGYAPGVAILSCVRISPYTATQVDAGRTFHSTGGIYRITAVGAPGSRVVLHGGGVAEVS